MDIKKKYKTFRNKKERDSFLINIRDLYNKHWDDLYDETNFKYFKEARELSSEYWLRLPMVSMAVCPFCQTPVWRRFDPFGLDSSFWRFDTQNHEFAGAGLEEPCEHFFQISGALNYNRKDLFLNVKIMAALETNHQDVVPFVVPYVLEPESRVAVISQLETVEKCIAYPIIYFDKLGKDNMPERHTGPWNASSYRLDTSREALKDDYNLLPWLESKKLFWCDPSTDNTKLSKKSIQDCPFLDLEDYFTAELFSGHAFLAGYYKYLKEENRYFTYSEKSDEYKNYEKNLYKILGDWT